LLEWLIFGSNFFEFRSKFLIFRETYKTNYYGRTFKSKFEVWQILEKGWKMRQKNAVLRPQKVLKNLRFRVY